MPEALSPPRAGEGRFLSLPLTVHQNGQGWAVEELPVGSQLGAPSALPAAVAALAEPRIPAQLCAPPTARSLVLSVPPLQVARAILMQEECNV